MGTNKQWKRVPFTIELAKKIQSGEVDDLDSMLNELKTICNKGITTKHEFKPFDKVLVRDEKCNKWYPTIIGYVSPINGRYCDICRNLILSDTLPYEGNEHLVGKTDNPE